jgi:hypothetical protein
MGSWIAGLALAVVGCGSSESGSSPSPTSGGTSTTTTTSGAGGATSAGGAGGQATTSTAAGGSGGATSAGGAGGGCASEHLLQVDSFKDKDQVAFESGFVHGECWAVSYEDDAKACSYDLRAIRVVVGGAAGTKPFTVAVWNVDADGAPSDKVGSAEVKVQASNSAFTQVELGSLLPPDFDVSRFAVAMCPDEHDGLPSIARDTDGITAGKNYIFTNGAWAKAESLGLKGDFIQRAVLSPKK